MMHHLNKVRTTRTKTKRRLRALFASFLSLVTLSAAVGIIISALGSPNFLAAYGQVQQQQQTESDEGFEATLNGESFRKGDTITVTGTVEEPDPESFVTIEVIDPESTIVVQGYPELTADDTFTYSFEAGGEDEFDIVEPMTESGNYRMVVTFFEGTDDFDIVELEFEFQYASIPAGAATGTIPEAPSLPSLPMPSLPTTIFQSNADGIRVGLPDGWVAEDLNNTDPGLRQSEQSYGAGVLVQLCPQDQATPQIGGTYLCPNAEVGLDSVSVWRFADLKSRPEFAGVVQRNQSITTTDLVAFYFLFLEQKANFTNFRLLENIDTTINVVDRQSNEIIATAPAKYIEMTFLDDQGIPNEGDFALLVLGNDSNTGYALLPVTSLVTAGQLPPEHQLIFDSFELVAANNTNAMIISASPPSPFQQQQQQEQQPSPSPQSERPVL